MSLNSSRRAPTPFHHHIDARSNDSRSVLPSPTIFASPRSPASAAASSWIDDVASRTSSPSPCQWVVPLPPDGAAQPGRLLSPDVTFHVVPPSPSLPSSPSTGHYPQTQAPPLAAYASVPGSDRGSVSSPRSASSAHTHSSARDRAERDRNRARGRRHLDTVPCQICLQQVTACRCVGGEEARLMMREAANEVFNRGQGARDYRPTQRIQEPQAALQVGTPGYTEGYGYAAGYGAPVAYAGSPFTMNSGPAIAAGGYAGSYYGSPVAMSASQTWGDGQHGSSGPVWGVRES